MEGAFEELNTYLRGGSQAVLPSKTPELVRLEVYGLLPAHYAVRGLMQEAAMSDPQGSRDPDTLSFTHAVRVIRSTLPRFASITPRGQRRVWLAYTLIFLPSERGERELEPRPRGRARHQAQDEQLQPAPTPQTTNAPLLLSRGDRRRMNSIGARVVAS